MNADPARPAESVAELIRQREQATATDRKRGTDDEDPKLLSRETAMALIGDLEMRRYTVELKCTTIAQGEYVGDGHAPREHIRREITVVALKDGMLGRDEIRVVLDIAEAHGRPCEIDSYRGLKIR